MKLAGINEIAAFLGVSRETVRKKIADMSFVDGPNSAKLYDSSKASRAIFGSGATGNGRSIDYAQAQCELAVARKEEIELNMEVTSRTRVPIEVCDTIDERTFTNVAGLIKSHEGKPLTAALIGDIFSELRQLSSELRNWKDQWITKALMPESNTAAES